MNSRIRNRSSVRPSWSARHGFRLPRRSAAVLAALMAAGGAMTCAAHADILELYGRTLTAYSADNETFIGKVWPRDLQRGVNFDGTLRMPAVQPWALAGNPFSEGWDAEDRLQDIRLDTGTYNPTDVDIALPAPGFSWVIGRSFNGRQFDTSADYTSNGPQGKNWMQMSQAEVVFSTGSSASEDVVYIVYGADRALEFQRTGSMSEIFKGKNGAAGLVKHTPGDFHNVLNPNDDEPELFEYYDQNGTVTTFFGSIGTASQAWQIWKITDPAGNIAYVGDPSDPLAARNGYTSSAFIAKAYDTADRRYSYSYSSSAIGGIKRLTQVKVETKTGGTWASPSGLSTVAQVDYDYYTSTDDTNDIGLAGDLKTVTITTPLTDSGVDLVKTKYYRYYTRAYADSDGRRGEAHQIRMVMGYEGCRNKDWADGGGLDGSFTSVTFANEINDLKPYAEAYFEYYAGNDADNPLKLKSAYLHGLGGCGACGTGTYTLNYAKSSTCDTDRADTNYDTAWATRTVVGQPDGTYFTQYFDETGQALSHVLTDAVPTSYTKLWATYAARNSAGQLTAIHSPAQIGTGYTHDSGGSPSGSFTTSGGTGLVTTFNRVSGGNMDGFPEAVLHQEGTGTAYFDSWTQYTSRDMSVSSVTLSRPFVETRRLFHAESDDPDDTDTYDETTALDTGSSVWWSSTSTDVLYVIPQKIVSLEPKVTTVKNGSDSPTSTERYIREDGTTAFTKAQDGILTYTKLENGQVTLRIEDVNTTSGDIASADDYHDVFSQTEVNQGIHRKTTYAYDPQGRSDTTTMPDGHVAKMYYSKIGDGRMATIALPAYSSSTTTWYGPASYTVSNHAGKPGLRCTLAISGSGIDTTAMGKDFTYWITEGTSDPIDALFSDLAGASRANIFNLSTTIYDDPGTRVTETRSYVNMIPTSTWTGSAGTDYDAGTVVYDDMGRTIRTVDGTGTISRISYDTPGRVYRRHIGTDDTGDAGSPMAGSNNMVKVEELEYDSNADHGNNFLTKRTLYVENSTTDQRVTTYTNDYRGRMVLQTNPVAPHTLNKYDTRGRLIASAQYTSTGSITVGTSDPTGSNGTYDTPNRSSISQTKYDERGQVYQTVRHEVDQSDGSDDDSVATDFWYDPAGRRIKVRGSEYGKTRYDRLGRVVAVYTLATDNDSNTYSNIYSSGQTSVAGDTIMDERVTWYDDDTNEALVTATISRHITDTTTSDDLDSNADGNDAKFTAADITGRIQITANWYDALHRVESTVNYGTNQIVGNGSADVPHDFTQPGSAPTGSGSLLRTDYAYDTAGRVSEVTDPRGKITVTEYDAAGRKVKTIANWVNGAPSGADNDDDIITRYVYSATHMTQMWVDIDGDENQDSDEPVTTYTYGVVKGTDHSLLSSNRLLYKVVFPPQEAMQSEADHRMLLGYDAQADEIWRQDANGSVFETEYDDTGRVTDKRFSTIGSGLDTRVQRISYAYLSRGLLDTVTQYSAPSGGTAKDQVQYSYDGWGNVTKVQQDPDSAIGVSGRDEFDVQYAWHNSDPSAGRHTLRLDTMTQPDGTSLTYYYGAANSTNDRLSRVGSLKFTGGATIALYYYMGAGQMVGTTLDEPYVKWERFTTTLGDYPDLDVFNRVNHSRWTKILISPVDFYSVDVGYDENSNIASTVDNVQLSAAISGDHTFDVVYSIDGLNRVTEAAEGEKSGASIDAGKQARLENWTLTQTGNFHNNQLDLNWDSDLTDNGDVDDTRAHNNANEIDSWDPRGTSYDPDYNKNGNLTDDKRDYKYVYDALNRLTSVKNQSSQLVAEYTYNGLGQRTAWHYDADGDNDVDGSDVWFYFCYDSSWRIAATYRDTDAEPKEQFVYHAAGLDGRGGSSYLDSVALRDRDMTNSGTPVDFDGAGDGTLEERRYFCQNWRGDVSTVLTDAGEQVQSVKYFAYGMPYGLPVGDLDGDGDYDTTDDNTVAGWSSGYDVRADADLDGSITGSDAAYLAPLKDTYLGRGVLTSEALGNRKGFAGYENDGVLADSNTADPQKTANTGRMWHARGGVFDSTLGRALQRGGADASNSEGTIAQSSPTPTTPPLIPLICAGSDKVLAIIQHLGDAGCSPPAVIPAPAKSCLTGQGAEYDCQTNTIKICPGAKAVCDDYIHELIHAYDYCVGVYKCPKSTPPAQSDCRGLACSEVRAYLLSKHPQVCNSAGIDPAKLTLYVTTSVRSARGCENASDQLIAAAIAACTPACGCSCTVAPMGPVPPGGGPPRPPKFFPIFPPPVRF